MNAQQAATLCRAVKAICPGQKLDDLTPDFWFPLLEDIDFDAAKTAVIEVGKRQPFIAPAEIRAEVLAAGRRLVAAIPAVTPPWQLADLQAEEQRWISNYRHAIADGLPEETARAKANHLSGITNDPEPLAIDAGPAALKAQMEADALALVRKQSLAAAEERERADEKRERYRRIRESELARTDEESPPQPAPSGAASESEVSA